jgi:hypothetical protein
MDGPGAAGFCGGNNCLEKTGVPVVDGEVSGHIFSSISPPLPELTVMCGGRRGLNDSSGSIATVEGGGDSRYQNAAHTALFLGFQECVLFFYLQS